MCSAEERRYKEEERSGKGRKQHRKVLEKDKDKFFVHHPKPGTFDTADLHPIPCSHFKICGTPQSRKVYEYCRDAQTNAKAFPMQRLSRSQVIMLEGRASIG